MSSQSPIPSLAELKAQRKPIRNVALEHRERLSSLEKLAAFITKHIGSMGFFLIIFSWTVLWIGWNTLGPAESRFDPFPAFVLWLFISNMIQIFLMPLLMVGQNLQNKYNEARAAADFDVNVKAEREIEAILQHLERQSEVLGEMRKGIEKKN